MYETIKKQITEGDFDLSQLLAKLDVALAQGQLREDECQRLRQLAQEISIARNTRDIAAKLAKFLKEKPLTDGQPDNYDA